MRVDFGRTPGESLQFSEGLCQARTAKTVDFSSRRPAGQAGNPLSESMSLHQPKPAAMRFIGLLASLQHSENLCTPRTSTARPLICPMLPLTSPCGAFLVLSVGGIPLGMPKACQSSCRVPRRRKGKPPTQPRARGMRESCHDKRTTAFRQIVSENGSDLTGIIVCLNNGLSASAYFSQRCSLHIVSLPQF